MNNYFKQARPIWAKDKLKELNCTLFFKTSIKKGNYKLTITANNVYRIFVNGNQIGYGPARAAHNYYRVDHYEIEANKNNNQVVIEVYGCNCNNFYVLNTEPFLQAEILNNNEVIKYTGKDFKVYPNIFRYRKVSRFSYQRAFSESYKIDYAQLKTFLTKNKKVIEPLKVVKLKEKTLLDRNIDYPKYGYENFKKKEYGYITIDKTLKPYEDRYMYQESIILFPVKDWEIDPNKVVSQFVPHLGEKKNILEDNDFITFGNDVSYTGFISLDINVIKDAVVYVYFDEVNTANPDEKLIGIKFHRNTTHNIISYELTKGKYHLVSFEPYTAKYIRVVVAKGEAKVSKVGIYKYENPNRDALKYNFKNKKIQVVLDAAVNTFAQNAVDILTDCPSRERAGWLCDSFFSGQAEQLITGENQIERNFLENYALYKESVSPKNLVPCCYPSDFGQPMFIVQWSLWYLNELMGYMTRTGDTKLIEISKKNILNLLKYYNEFSNEDGLLEDLQGWRFVEWSKANDDEFVSGVNYPTNMLYYKALHSAATLLNDNSLLEKASNIKKKIIEQSFTGEFFVDNSLRDKQGKLYRTDHMTETCQYYAFYFGVADTKTFSKLFNKMRKEFGPNRDDQKVYPNVYKSNVLPGDILRLSVLNENGYAKDVFNESVDYFYRMAKLSGTLWELDHISCSLNHAFTSYTVNMIIEANFGLHLIDNKNKVIYMLKKGLYNDATITIPLPHGETLEFVTKNKHIDIKCPSTYKIAYL